jgi:hypothetical protein
MRAEEQLAVFDRHMKAEVRGKLRRATAVPAQAMSLFGLHRTGAHVDMIRVRRPATKRGVAVTLSA